MPQLSRKPLYPAIALLLLSLGSVTSGAQPAVRPLCPPGNYEFIVTEPGKRLMNELGVQRIKVTKTGVSLPSVCPETHAELETGRDGLRLDARWPSCGALRQVKLHLTILGPLCGSASGQIEFDQEARREFKAAARVCTEEEVSEAKLGEAVGRGLSQAPDAWVDIDDFAYLLKLVQADLGCAMEDEALLPANPSLADLQKHGRRLSEIETDRPKK